MPFYQDIKEVAINLIPFGYGQKKQGVEHAPSHLVSNGLRDCLQSLNLNIAETVEVQLEPISSMSETTVEICSRICESTARIVENQAKLQKFCLNIGGDHSNSAGSIGGLLRVYPDLCVLWVDAHLDINSVASSPSGNAHGMPVSFLLDDHRTNAQKQLPEKAFEFCRKNLLHPSRLAYLGIRQADEWEVETVRNLNIATYDIKEIERIGIVHCVTSAIRKIDPTLSKPIHVSFDIDCLDPSLTPSTGTPVVGGLTMRELLEIAERVHNTGRMVGLDIMEFNPMLGDEHDVKTTLSNTLESIKAFLGEKRPHFN